MDNHSEHIDCHDDDVVAFGDSTFKVGRFKQAIRACFGYDFGYGLIPLLKNQGVKIDQAAISPQGNKADFGHWFGTGVNCELLQTDTLGWQGAKVRIRVEVEFIQEQESAPVAKTEPQEFGQFEDPEFDADVTIHADIWSDNLS